MSWMATSAVLAVVVAILLVLLLRQRKAGARAEQRCLDSKQAIRCLEDQLDTQRHSAVVGVLAGDIGQRLQTEPEPTESPRATTTVAMLARWRALVEDYDRSVQYCLQPVDLIPGADPADMQTLLRHVGDARGRLFSSRRELLQSDIPGRLAKILQRPERPHGASAELAAALGRMAMGSRAAQQDPTDVNALLGAALLLTEARMIQPIPIIRRLEAVPSLAPAPWLGAVLLQLLDMAVSAAGCNGRLMARTLARERCIEVHLIGHAVGPAKRISGGAGSREDGQFAEIAAQLDRHGARLDEMGQRGNGLGMVLRLPVRQAGVRQPGQRVA